MRVTTVLVGIFCLCAAASGSARGGAEPSTVVDNRIPIDVSAGERNEVLQEMREYLHSLFNIHNALARKDMAAVARSAKSMGHVLQRFPPKLQERLPVAFMEMSHGMHEIFEVMARDAEAKQDVGHSLGQVAEALTYCSGCHDTYRFQTREAKATTRRR